ncbi:MAG TPA: protein kinase [Pyrinomonadaceae bacterium]|nr:protein kinase [Pyrinomonadaceae bacterium]
MSIIAGTTLGRYEIRSLIGAGGMGEVYLAHDSQMRRPVALKLLPPNFTQDEDRLRRFEQEAYSASGLNHPNILTIYEIGQVDATRFIAMEYVEGETLRQHLSRGSASSGEFPGAGVKLHDALEIAIQLASAIAASQAAGIAHRDIKPENIILRRDGYVKVLDFGLAKLTEKPATTDTEAPTRAMVNTSPGAVMGTVNYMSPEQASGHTVDARTDIWSLGVLLYEMVTGSLPFQGPTPSHVIVAILEKDPPPLARYISEAPEALEWIITKALTRNRDDRYQTAREMLTDLRRLKQRLDASAEIERSIAPDMASARPQTTLGSTIGGAATVSAFPLDQRTAPVGAPTVSSAEYLVKSMGRHKLAMGIAVVVLLGLLAGGVAFWLSRRGGTAHTFRKVKLSQLTSTGKAILAAMSPDGKYVVHAVSDGTLTSLWVRQVATSSNVQIVAPGPLRFIGLTFSPDGNYVYYVVYDGNNPLGVAYQIPVLGGQPQKIMEDVDTPLTFSPDGKQFAWIRNFPQSGETTLMIANSDGSSPRKVASRARPKRFGVGNGLGPAWAPEGESIACPVAGPENGIDRSAIVLVNAMSGTEQDVTPQRWGFVQQVAWAPHGAGLLVSAQELQAGSSQIWYVTVPGGTVEKVTNDLNNYNGASLSGDGTKLATVQRKVSSSVWFAPLANADSGQKLTSGTNEGGGGIALLPDGRIVYSVTATGTADLFVVNSDGSNPRQLTSNAAVNVQPAVSADGRWIVFLSTRTGAPHIWRIDTEGNNLKQLTNGIAEVNPEISPDGQWVIFQDINDLGLSKVSIEGGAVVQITDKLVSQGAISPDGKLIACRYREQGLSPFKLGILDFATGQVLKTFDTPPQDGAYRWSADGRAVLYSVRQNGVSNIWSQSIDGGTPKQLTNFKSDLIFGFNISKDGKSVAVTRGSVANDVLLIADQPE